ncbi:hypothetical protein, partial [uncultured Intestinimonas sp.]|uniref:hypothetical protein n=2 Tax=Intestinimonas TaxID=1392389 RepID=UPI00294229B7
MPDKIPFFTLFSAWSPTAEFRSLLGETAVCSAVIDKTDRSLQAELTGLRPLSAELLDRVAAELTAVYGLRSTQLRFAPAEPVPAELPEDDLPPWEEVPPPTEADLPPEEEVP